MNKRGYFANPLTNLKYLLLFHIFLIKIVFCCHRLLLWGKDAAVSLGIIIWHRRHGLQWLHPSFWIDKTKRLGHHDEATGISYYQYNLPATRRKIVLRTRPIVLPSVVPWHTRYYQSLVPGTVLPTSTWYLVLYVLQADKTDHCHR